MAEIDGIEAGRRLKRHHDALLADMNAIEVMDQLMTPDLLKDEVVQNVSAATREHGQIEGSRRLLEYLRPLVRHQPRALDEIIAALRRASTEHLADLLAQPLSPIRPDIMGKDSPFDISKWTTTEIAQRSLVK
eukprot:scpid104358/ scgid35452/ 